MCQEKLRAPFPWFGGKSRVATIVWRYFGDVEHYVEPFFGSGAVLLGRPTAPRVETVNDKDGYVANFWRAVQHDPDAVARYADNPVFENDLHARHIWLVQNAPERLARLEGDPDWYDAKIAGWWVWGISCWIGGGWCSGDGPWVSVDGRLVRRDDESNGIKRTIIHLGDAGKGINRTTMGVADVGNGVLRSLPHLSSYGQGVNRSDISASNNPILDLTLYMRALANRLRRVRVCCGDWSRVVTTGALSHGETVGIFLDPPYDSEVCDIRIYKENNNLSSAVREWAIANGDNPRYRIALCGYEGEHEMPSNWHVYKWSAGRCYGTSTSVSTNRHKERVWFSPHCLHNAQLGLFDESA